MKKNVNLRQILYRYKAHHILFWCVYFVFWVMVYKSMYPLKNLLVNTALYTFFNIIAFYLIAYYLFPRYLYKRKYGYFFLGLVLVISLSSTGLAASLFLVTNYLFNFPYKTHVSIYFLMAFSSMALVVGILTTAKLLWEKIWMEKQRLAAELQYLKAQVNPHFLFNAINSVYFLIKKDPDKASETLVKLSDLLRFQLYDCSSEKIAIEKELEYLQNYIELEKLRKGDKVKVTYATDNNLHGFQIAPFMLIPFLENAFKFISSYRDAPNEINISFRREGDQFMAIFRNTCEHITPRSVGGIGLKNVKRRLELLYPEKYQLDIAHKADIYCVTLSLNIL